MQTDSLVDVAALNSLISNQSVKPIKIVYTTMQSGPGTKPEIVKNHPRHYIPGSIEFDLQGKFSLQNTDLSNTMISAEAFCNGVRDIGINNDDHLVVYDDFGNFCASRVWFMFKTMGHKNVAVLDGGLPAWLNANYPVTHQFAIAQCSSRYVTKPNPNFQFVDANYVLDKMNDNNYAIIDARSLARFTGTTPELKAHLRAGHIPGSFNMHYASLQDNSSCFLPLDILINLFASYKNKQLIFSCGSGITACVLAQGAALCGIDKLMVYDGSWSQWGANPIYPISTGNI